MPSSAHMPLGPLRWMFFALGGCLLMVGDVGQISLPAMMSRLVRVWTKQPEQTNRTHCSSMALHSDAQEAAQAEAIRYMDAFLGIASHELRTPLTSMKMYVDIALVKLRKLAEKEALADPAEAEQLRALLGLLERSHLSIERMNRLVSDLLITSQIQSGALDLFPTTFDVSALVRQIVTKQQSYTPQRLIQFEASEVATVHADVARIEQVVLSYLSNALKYATAAMPIVVRLRQREGMVRVEVTDRGPGLSPEQQRLLFQRFSQVEGIEQQQDSSVGLGLGLYMSRKIIEQQGGQVGVNSRVGDGATFWFTLPLVPAQP